MYESKTISISQDGVLAGEGNLMYTPENGGYWYITNCPAELGSNSAETEAAYEQIEEAINAGHDSALSADHEWTWLILDS